MFLAIKKELLCMCAHEWIFPAVLLYIFGSQAYYEIVNSVDFMF